MTTAQKRRRTYWVADVVTPVLKDRALLLGQKGFDVQFFTSVDALAAELEARRASIIVVSDDGDEQVTEKILTNLMMIPEIAGARLVMVRNAHSDRINYLAACANFRDIIPSHLDERQWLARFLFATAGKAVPFVQPAGQITLNNISAVSVPARITWISDTKLRLECRLKPPVGATLTLGGAFADAASVGSISLKVVDTQRSHLLYRFSDAIVAEWSVPATARDAAKRALQELKAHDPGPRCRIFVAAQSAALRQQVLTRFEDPRFEISTALQKQAIVDEPRFFTPDVVFIEDELCAEEQGARFHQMMANLTEACAVVILGKVERFDELQKRWPGRKILMLTRVPKTLSQSVLARYLPASGTSPETAAGASHVVAEHPWSLAEVSLPARLHRLHPLAAQLVLPYPLGNFALVRLESPLVRKMLGRNPYVKVTATYQDMHPDAAPFVHVADCYLADLDQGERKTMAGHLTKLIADSLGRLDGAGSIVGPKEKGGNARTPELGSVTRAPVAEAPAPAPEPVRPPPPAPARQVAALAALGAPAPTPVPPRPAAPAPKGAAATAPALRPPSPGAVIDSDLDDEVEGPKLIPTQEIAELIKPALSPFVEAAGGLKDEALGKVRATVEKNKDHAKHAVVFALVAGLGALLLWFVYAVLAPHWEHSGGEYSDQLKKFAPHLNQPNR